VKRSDECDGKEPFGVHLAAQEEIAVQVLLAEVIFTGKTTRISQESGKVQTAVHSHLLFDLLFDTFSHVQNEWRRSVEIVSAVDVLSRHERGDSS
jgi:hypothetical protein